MTSSWTSEVRYLQWINWYSSQNQWKYRSFINWADLLLKFWRNHLNAAVNIEFEFQNSLFLKFQFLVPSVKDLRSLHTESEIFVCVFRIFRIRHPFLSKCLLRMQKRRKSNLVRIFIFILIFIFLFFMTDEGFGGSVETWLTPREVVFIFQRAKISDSVCNGLYLFIYFLGGASLDQIQ